MTNHEMARSYLRTATHILREAREALAEGVWNLAVRRSQESVELALKAALRLAGIEVPKVHDVAVEIRESAERFPGWWNEGVERLARISRHLRHDREVSLYGDDETGLPPERIFTRVDAEEAVSDAAFVVDASSRLFSEHVPPPTGDRGG